MNATANNQSARTDNTLLKAVLAGGGLFLLWRFGRALGSAFWALLGIAMAMFWSGGWLLLR